MDARVSKAAALRSLAASLGLSMDEVVAVGDGLNDRDMIEAAGFGVAMANGHPETKKAADYVTLSNDEDGLADLIEKVILKEDA